MCARRSYNAGIAVYVREPKGAAEGGLRKDGT